MVDRPVGKRRSRSKKDVGDRTPPVSVNGRILRRSCPKSSWNSVLKDFEFALMCLMKERGSRYERGSD